MLSYGYYNIVPKVVETPGQQGQSDSVLQSRYMFRMPEGKTSNLDDHAMIVKLLFCTYLRRVAPALEKGGAGQVIEVSEAFFDRHWGLEYLGPIVLTIADIAEHVEPDEIRSLGNSGRPGVDDWFASYVDDIALFQ